MLCGSCASLWLKIVIVRLPMFAAPDAGEGPPEQPPCHSQKENKQNTENASARALLQILPTIYPQLDWLGRKTASRRVFGYATQARELFQVGPQCDPTAIERSRSALRW